MFSTRIVNVDHYLSTPHQGLDITYSQFRGSQVKQVPIIRIFGSTPGGKKTCLHIHGVFPYLLVPYDGSDDVQRLMYVIAASLDKAINISLGISNSNKQHVFKILQVSGSPFYGYHDVEHQFLKIFLYNPNMVKRASDLLQNGAICNKVLQPHESHVPFILQFFIDYNLYGMSFIQLKHVICRRSADEQSEISENGFEIPLRISRCELEVDALATDIHNKLELSEKLVTNPGLAAIWEEEKQRKKDDSSFFDPVESQPRLKVQPTFSEVLLKDKLKNTLALQLRSPSLKVTPQSLIPYPAETQEGCDILNASALNTHSMTSNTTMPDNMFDGSVINEDVILNLTSELDETCFLNSQDQSLLNVLENLAEDVELGVDKQTPCSIEYNVEADSILGSQLLTNEEEEEDLIEACQQIDNLDLQYDTRETAEEQTEELQHLDDNIWEMSNSEDIPQVDGTDDVLDITKSEKEKRVTEDDDSCSVIEVTEVESNILWPIVGNGKEVDCCDEVFSDSNESINFVERNSCEVYEPSDVIKVEIKNNFEHILRGDPSFMSQTITSSEDTSFYTSKESLTCAWNNLLPLPQSENSDIDEFSLAKLNDVNKIEDRKNEFTAAVDCDLSELNVKNLQFNETLVPLLNLPDCEEIVYNNYVDEGQSIFSDEILGKSQLVDIFRENVTSQYVETQVQNVAEFNKNAIKDIERQPNNSNRRSEIQNKTKENLTPLKEKLKPLQNMKLKVKFKFPVKGETNKLNKKLLFRNYQTSFDLTEEYVTSYFKKLEKLKEFYLSRRKIFSCKQNVNYSKLQAKDKLSKKIQRKIVQNYKFKNIMFEKYKLKECSVLIERLQLTSDVIKSRQKTKKTNSPKKIINQFEVLQSRPFSTEIIKSNTLPNLSSKTIKSRNFILEKDVNKVPVKTTNIRENVKHLHKEKNNCITKCKSKKKLSYYNLNKLEDNVHKLKPIKCKKKYKCNKQSKKYKESSNLKDKYESFSDSDKSNFAHNSLKKSDFNESSCANVSQTQKINQLKETARGVVQNNECKNKQNHKDYKIGLSPCKQNGIGVTGNNKKRTRNNFNTEIKTELVSARYKCNEKKEKIEYDLNSCKGNFLKTCYQSGENIEIRKNLVVYIDKLNINSESLKRKNDSPNKNCSELGEMEIKMSYIGIKKDNENRSSKSNKCRTSDNKMQNNKIIGSESLEICKRTQNKKVNKSLRSEREKQKKKVEDSKTNSCENIKLITNSSTSDNCEIEKKFCNNRSSSEHLEISNHTQDNRKTKTMPSEWKKKKVEFICRKRSQNRELKSKDLNHNSKIEMKMCIDSRSTSEQLKIYKETKDKVDKFSYFEKKEQKEKPQGNKRNCSQRRLNIKNNENNAKVKQAEKISYELRKNLEINEQENDMDKRIFFRKDKQIQYKKQNKLDDKEIKIKNHKKNRQNSQEKEMKIQVNRINNNHITEMGNNAFCNIVNNVKLMEISQKSLDCKNNNSYQQIEKKMEMRGNSENLILESKTNSSQIKNVKRKSHSKKINYSQPIDIEMKTEDNKRKKSSQVEDKIVKTQKCMKTEDRVSSSIGFVAVNENIQVNKRLNSEKLDNIGNKSKRKSVIHSILMNKTKSNCPQKLSNTSQSRKYKSVPRRNISKLSPVRCLDGNVDCSSSSSDESIEAVKLNVKLQTPQKEKVPSINPETPTRRYERLNIQIKKSPKSEKLAGTSAEDFKLNTAVVQVVRNSELEQMLNTKEPDLQSLTSSSNKNRRRVKESVKELRSVNRLKDNLTNEAKQNFCFSNISKRSKTSPFSLLTNEENNIRVVNLSSDRESSSRTAENIRTLSPICSSKESKSSSDLKCNLDIELNCKADKSQQDFVDTGVNKTFVTSVKSETTSTEETIKLLKNSVEVKNKVSKKQNQKLPRKLTRKEEKPSTSSKDCDKKIPTKSRFQAELRVCLRRLSPNYTDDFEKPVSKQKRPLNTDFVDQSKASDDHRLDIQAKSRLFVNSSSEESIKVSSCKTKVVRKMLNFQPDEISNENDDTLKVCSFENLPGSKSPQFHLLSPNSKQKDVLSKRSLKDRKSSIDLFASNSSDTVDSVPSFSSKNYEHKNPVCPNFSLEQSHQSDLFDSNNSITNEFAKFSHSIKQDENTLDSINDYLNTTLQHDDDDDEGILSFYNKTYSEEYITQCSNLNEFNILKTSNKVFSDGNLNKNLYQPSREPPTNSKVKEKLSELGFGEVVNEGPFYSNPCHSTNAGEIGGRILKVTSKSTTDLEEYQGISKSISEWQNAKLEEICGISQIYKDSFSVLSVLASDRKTVITPLKSAPLASEAKFWIRAKSSIDNNSKPAKEKSIIKINKISIPLSPGEHSNTDEEEIILDTAYTPLTNSSMSSQHLVVQITPKELVTNLSSNMRTSTPLSAHSKKGLVKTRSLFRKSSQCSLLPPLAEENVETSCNESDRANLSYSSPEHENNIQQTSNLSNLLLDSQFRKQFVEKSSIGSLSYQIDAVTPDNTGGFRMALENLQQVHPVSQHQHLTVLAMELHIQTRGDLRPDPQYDPVSALFYNITNDYPEEEKSRDITGVLIVGSKEEYKRSLLAFRCELYFVEDEKQLLQEFVKLVHKWDPDILAGFEIEMFSWGYLLQRAYVLAFNLKTQLSRILKVKNQEMQMEQTTPENNEEEMKLTGRIVLNVWRFLRHEVALMSYTFENFMYHILHQRVPLFSFKTLSTWWSHRTHLHRWKTVEHYIIRVEGVVKLMNQLDLVGRTSELARLFGIQFYEVLSRGSQFRVESMMLRLAKPLNYVAVSPSVKQRAKMRAPETLPLIMEPQSRFYCDPMIVLDFQSLYPSIIIAYNYCFSTCLGRVEHLGQSEIFDFGCTQLKVTLKTLKKLEDQLNFSPCGIAFVKESVKKGVLPQMLEDILNTRLMVKKSMKEHKNNKTLQRVLHARQLGLKLIANVTYGYTSANFSGRMPCIEVGDSVVSKGRETLERAITLVGQTPKWGAQVVYGDTDSMFVLVPGKSKKEAFRIGAEIAEAVTNSNPKPVKLKLEKVYQPCILQTKKRYVGYMYESPDQEKPVYDAKGIETVRRDGCPAVAKVLEKSLRLLFETKDLSLVRKYVTHQFSKIILGRMSIQELTFAREYRGAAGYKPGACVPALELAKQWKATDPRAEPRVGERVPHVVVAGPPGMPLIRLVRSPSTLLLDSSLKINSDYYITRVIIPPLDRCFSLLGATVPSWYAELPRKHFICLPSTISMGSKKSTISQYFATMNCVVCQKLTTVGVCSECQEQPQNLAVALSSKLVLWERRLRQVTKLCESCCARSEGIECISLDCPVMYRRNQSAKDMNQADFVRQLQCEYLTF